MRIAKKVVQRVSPLLGGSKARQRRLQRRADRYNRGEWGGYRVSTAFDALAVLEHHQTTNEVTELG
jgi:hypothetical protein